MKLLTAMLLLSAAISVSGCHRQKPDPDPPGQKVDGPLLILQDSGGISASISSQPVTKTGVNRQIFNGRLLWNDDVTVRIFTPFAGRVTKVIVNPGEPVERETPLALIASPDFGQAQSDARRAESDFGQAERTVNRFRELFEHGAAAKKDLDSAEADLARVRAGRGRTGSRLQFYGGGSRRGGQVFPLTHTP